MITTTMREGIEEALSYFPEASISSRSFCAFLDDLSNELREFRQEDACGYLERVRQLAITGYAAVTDSIYEIQRSER